MEFDKGRLLRTMINLPYPMNCMPVGQQQIFAFIGICIEDANRNRRKK